ncbi:MAG TPA: HAMP domain-containing sensor histidine kinase, partial [Clostridia bacterium]|nr:HAMP domain-containing sensor histidine kinase [Clostridia bacterium]
VVFGIRIKFFITFFISLIAGFMTFLTINGIARNDKADFSSEILKANSHCVPVINEIKRNSNDNRKLQTIINQNISQFHIYVTDHTGKVLIEPDKQIVDRIDIKALEKLQADTDIHSKSSTYISNQMVYNKLEQLKDGRYIVISALLMKNDEAGAGLIGIIVFVLLFFVLTYGRIRYIKLLSNSLKAIANGDLNFTVVLKGKDELTLLAKNINHMTDELKTRKRKEEAAEQTKNELIANVSHDLRTPLTSIVGYTRLLKEKNRQDELAGYIEIIDEKSQRLKVLIEDLFDFTILNSCEVKLEKDNVSLNELLRQVVEGMLPFAGQNNMTIHYAVPEFDVIVDLDAEKMARVFENIIANAVKYSNRPGQVEITLTGEMEQAVFRIHNYGKRIGTEDIHKIFDRLYRTDEARSSETGGTGIGLSIAKSIVDLHGGRIWAESEENEVCFYVSLPLVPV